MLHYLFPKSISFTNTEKYCIVSIVHQPFVEIAVVALDIKFFSNKFESDIRYYLLYLLERKLDALAESVVARPLAIFSPVIKQGTKVDPNSA